MFSGGNIVITLSDVVSSNPVSWQRLATFSGVIGIFEFDCDGQAFGAHRRAFLKFKSA